LVQRHPSRRIIVIALLALAGCGSEPEQERADDPPATIPDTVSTPVPEPMLGGFDPGALAVGDSVLGLRVASMDVARAFEDSVWVGSVTFEGELGLRGIYQGHYDYPEVPAPCFHVTDSASVGRVPRFAPDSYSTRMKTWFCFVNADEAIDQLGLPEVPREASIVVTDFAAVRHFTDAVASARLLRTLEVGPPSRRSLLDP
jgi:hypothetical protein